MHCRWYPSMPCSRGVCSWGGVPGPGGSAPGGVSFPGGWGGGAWSGGCMPSVMAFWFGGLLIEGVLLVWPSGGLLLWPSGLVAFWLKVVFWYGLLGEAEGNNRGHQKAITPEGTTPEGHQTRRSWHQKATTPEGITPEGHYTRRPPNQKIPHQKATTPPRSRLQHTVKEQPVRILLECILVLLCSTKAYSNGQGPLKVKVKIAWKRIQWNKIVRSSLNV